MVVVAEPERRRAIAEAVEESFYVEQGFAPWISGAAALVVAALAFAAYATTLCPTISAGDSGELAVAATTLATGIGWPKTCAGTGT